MKNLHILETDSPSRLYIYDGKFYFTKDKELQYGSETITNKNIYITNDEVIKEGDYYLGDDGNIYNLLTIVVKNGKKIILTTDLYLIEDGVQAIDDDFLEWFVKNPSCECVEIERMEDGKYIDRFADGTIKEGIYENYKIIISQEEPKQTDEKGNPLTYWGGLKDAKKQTAVEFISKGLFDILQEAEDNNIFEVGTQNFKRYIEMFLEQAKEMEKRERQEVYANGFANGQKDAYNN
jgi:hypothetical protein